MTFRLQYLKIENYKNIKCVEFDFSTKDGITVLIGNNGCGKSNILEALSSIFAGLYQSRLHKPKFDYTIRYKINNNLVEIKLYGSKYSFYVDNALLSKTDFNKHYQDYLPKNVIACYSGESQRLWEKYYCPYCKRYSSKKSEVLPELPMIYINHHNLSISLLTLFLFDFKIYDDIKEFCTSKLNIKRIDNISLKYDLNKIKRSSDNSIHQMIKRLNKVDNISKLSTNAEILSLSKLKRRMSVMGEREFFKTMYAATMPDKKFITDISFDIFLNSSKNPIKIDDLSEGEKKNLLIITILEALADENSLLLFDEPDSHIHISRKAELKKLFDKYPDKRESIITTHSPTLTVEFDMRNIEGLRSDNNGYTSKIDGDKAKLVAELTNGMWNIQEQNIFLSSNKPITLLVEGKTDKTHIEEAFKRLKVKAKYKDLDFDVFAMNTCERIKDVLEGLSKSVGSEIQWNDRKIIGIVDNDGAGRGVLNKFRINDFNKKYHKIGQSNNFFIFLLPKKDKKYEDYTIENCYNATKYEEAFKSAVEKKTGHFDGLSIDKIANDLRDKSKIILADNCKSFDKKDFQGFIPIFDIIESIRKGSNHGQDSNDVSD